LLKRWFQVSGVSVQAGFPMRFFPDTRNLKPETSFLRTVESVNYFPAIMKDAEFFFCCWVQPGFLVICRESINSDLVISPHSGAEKMDMLWGTTAW